MLRRKKLSASILPVKQPARSGARSPHLRLVEPPRKIKTHILCPTPKCRKIGYTFQVRYDPALGGMTKCPHCRKAIPLPVFKD